MDYTQYRNGIFRMWEYVKSNDFALLFENDNDDNEYVTCGLCNPDFGIKNGRTENQMCPFDLRKQNIPEHGPCIDNCQIFSKGAKAHKLQIIMSKFICDFVTKEGIESLKDLNKACKNQKGVSKEAALDHMSIAEKVIKSTERFGGYNFSINGGKISAQRRNS